MTWLVKNVALTVGVALLRHVLRALENRIVTRTAVAAGDPASRWLGVTVNATPEQVAADPQVQRLLALPGVKVRVTPAPDGRSTEIAALPSHASGKTGPVSRAAGNDPRQPVRRALRNVKSLLETGEVLRMEPTPARTTGGKLIDKIARRSRGEGRL